MSTGDTGPAQTYVVRGWDYDRSRETELTFNGWLLAEESSQADEHVRLVHGSDGYAAAGDRCSACRWFEVRIYEKALPADASDDEVAGWVVETVGQSIVPGEVVRRQFRVTTEPRLVVSALVQQKGGQSFIPAISKRVLDQAADQDELLASVVDEVLVSD